MKHGIRRRLLRTFLVVSGIICLAMFYTTLVATQVVKSVAVSYKSNSELETFQNLVQETEFALEEYMQLRSYETIDNYYNFRGRLEEKSSIFFKKPSDNPVFQCEYVVSRLTASFLEYADAAIYARRAYKAFEADSKYGSAVEAYRFLLNKISELNAMYFHSNIDSYNIKIASVREISISCVCTVILIFFLSLVILYMMITNITNPLVEISEVANRLADRDFDIALFTYSKKDEIGNICRAFNHMIISIREYIDTIWEKAIHENELREKEMRMTELYQDARLQALQSQINPHFLFNTLNTGAQLAMMEGSDKTCHFLEQTADFYRYNLRQTGQDATLQEELSLLDSYIYIMKVRFGNRFDYSTDLKYGNLDIRIPGMILQPLVENCIKHGLRDVLKEGHIILSVFEGGIEQNVPFPGEKGFIYITVSDNGCGFPPDKREKLLRTGKHEFPEELLEEVETTYTVSASGKREKVLPETEKNGVGLKNVISRLRMYFKTDDVFDISTSKNGGTTFIIKIGKQHV